MRKVIPLLALAGIIAVLAFWHGATESPISQAALYLLPLLALALAVRSSKKAQRTRP